MGVDQPQALEPGGCRAEGVKVGNENPPVVPEDNHADFALAVDEQADLPVERAGKKGQFAREVVADDIFRRDAAAVETFQGFDLPGAKPRCVAEYFMNVAPSLISVMTKV